MAEFYFKMGQFTVNFANHLYSSLARKYAPPKNGGEGGPPVEEYDWLSVEEEDDWPTDEYNTDIYRAVLMLSFTYRPSFRRHFISVESLLCTSDYNATRYAEIFSQETYRYHSPLKILILCSFISEMYLFIFYRKGAKDINRHYTLPAILCLGHIYSSVLSKIDDPLPKWEDVQHSATFIASGYDILEPIMRKEHISECKPLITILEEVKKEQASVPEGDSSAERVPSKSKALNYSRRRMEILLKANRVLRQLKEASLKKSDSPIGDEKPKSPGKKPLSQPLETEAGTKSAESGSQAVASAANCFSLANSSVSTGKNMNIKSFMIYKSFLVPLAKNISPSSAVDEVSQSVPGVREEAQFSEDRKSEGSNDSPNSSNAISNKTRSGSSAAKKKSKKHKKKRGKK